MGDMPMHAPVGNHAHKMRRARCGAQCGGKVQNGGVLKETLIFNCQINLPQIHSHNPACADIGVANF